MRTSSIRSWSCAIAGVFPSWCQSYVKILVLSQLYQHFDVHLFREEAETNCYEVNHVLVLNTNAVSSSWSREEYAKLCTTASTARLSETMIWTRDSHLRHTSLKSWLHFPGWLDSGKMLKCCRQWCFRPLIEFISTNLFLDLHMHWDQRTWILVSESRLQMLCSLSMTFCCIASSERLCTTCRIDHKPIGIVPLLSRQNALCIECQNVDLTSIVPTFLKFK